MEIKSDIHFGENKMTFDLWFFEALLDETVRADNAKGFCNLIDSNPELADKYFERKHFL